MSLIPFECTIFGAKASKFEMDSFSEDCVHIHAMVDMSENGYGYGFDKFNYGTSAQIDEFKDVKFPTQATLFLKMQSSGKKSKLVCEKVQIKKANS